MEIKLNKKPIYSPERNSFTNPYICFSSKPNTKPPIINKEAKSFHDGSSSPKYNAELKNPTTGIISVK
ncbi:MAG TPA: hypothetical protein VGD90_11310, partial [Sphingobacteriaceae bacterium]